ncbi:MAG: keto-deoxy-phosphogluconate aldolase [Gammaproteobacteria bacterium RIFCSPLOWO2_02_FULL_61_13]|nr:MAG: keto-deoxy-phosphogluconate aldolase [Gammaproteobacteria bacterium RIFCSPLOWO2_02_FULL_61_13]
MSTDWTAMKRALVRCPIIPVLTVKDVAQAAPLAQALVSAEMTVLEVTLRTDCAVDAIRIMAAAKPDAWVGGGTALAAADIERIIGAGGRFVVTPGAPARLLAAAVAAAVPVIPGIATVTEALTARDAGFRFMKFFPAGPAGGAAALKAFAGPLPDLVFCPTGGVSLDNLADYLSLPNVVAVGGSWMVPENLITQGRFDEIAVLARRAVDRARQLRP